MNKTMLAKETEAYESLSPEAKLLCEYCLETGANGKRFKLDYDKFNLWLKERTNNETLLRI